MFKYLQILAFFFYKWHLRTDTPKSRDADASKKKLVRNTRDYLLTMDEMVGGDGEMEGRRCSVAGILAYGATLDEMVERRGGRGGWVVGVVTGATLVEKVGRRGWRVVEWGRSLAPTFSFCLNLARRF